MKNKIFTILFFQFIFSSLLAQTKDFGMWTTFRVEKKIGKWDLGVNAELRTINKLSNINRLSYQLEVAYRIVKPFKIGVSYKYISFHDIEYSDFQPRQRYIIFAQGRLKYGNLIFTLSEQLQRTVKDESDRINEGGNYDNYKINPEWNWCNCFRVAYNIPHVPVTPSFSFESFYQLNNPDGKTFDKLRYKLSFKYKLSKHHALDLYGLSDNEINVENPVKTFVGGLRYTFSF
jgi:hypothetical protein